MRNVGGQVWQLCGVGVVGYKPTTPPQSWPTHPPHLHHKPTKKVAGFVVKLWWPEFGCRPLQPWCGPSVGGYHTLTTPHHTPTTKCGGSVAGPNQ